jgi:hypothetical protein
MIPEGISLGPPFRLSEQGATPLAVGEIDEEGRAMVFVALSQPEGKKWDGVHLLAVSGQKVADQGVVLHRKGGRRSSLARGLPLWGPVLENTRWDAKTPGGGGPPEMPDRFAFTVERDGLVRAVMVGGTPEGAGTSWDRGSPGVGNPTMNRIENLAVIRQIDGEVDQFVFTPEEGAPILNSRIAVDRAGAVHVLYERGEREDGLRYARIPSADFRPVKFFESAWKTVPEPSVGRYGIPLRERESMGYADGLAVAADPETHLAMIAVIRSKPDRDRVVTRTIFGGEVGRPLPLASKADGVLLAAAGGDRFHALVHDRAPESRQTDRIVYRAWRDESWSEPILLGSGDALAALIADGAGRALAIWRAEGRLLARWIRLD